MSVIKTIIVIVVFALYQQTDSVILLLFHVRLCQAGSRHYLANLMGKRFISNQTQYIRCFLASYRSGSRQVDRGLVSKANGPGFKSGKTSAKQKQCCRRKELTVLHRSSWFVICYSPINNIWGRY